MIDSIGVEASGVSAHPLSPQLSPLSPAPCVCSHFGPMDFQAFLAGHGPVDLLGAQVAQADASGQARPPLEAFLAGHGPGDLPGAQVAQADAIAQACDPPCVL